jgi:hypothetical protein
MAVSARYGSDGAFHHPDGGEALVFRVTPRKVLAFGKGPFTQTSYRFATPSTRRNS